MASTPSSTSTRHGRRRRMNEAWQQTTHNTRKIQLKLKHSLSNLSSREIPFEQEPGRRSRRGYVSNIDQALGAFGKHRLQDLDVVEEPGEDWILDGHDEWQQQYQRSNELLAQWQGSSFTEAEWLWKLGSIGNQEYQFAQFDSESCVNNLNNETDEDEDEDEDEDMSSFGDFQEASKEQGEDARTEPNPQGVLTQDIQEHAIPPWENVDINLPPTRPTSTSFTCMERTPDHAADAGAPFPQTMQRTPLEQPPLALEAAPGTLQIPRTPLNQPFDSAVALATNAPSLPNKIDRTPLGNMERNPLPETSSTRFTHANIDRRKDSLSPVGILNKQAMAERSYPTRVNMDIRPLPEQIEATNTCSTPAPSEPAPAPASAPAGILHQIEWTTPLPNTTMEEKKEAATVDSFVTTPILSEPTSPANKNQNINKELDSVMDKLEHSYSYSTPEHSKPEPKTPTATNVSKQQQQKQKQKKYHLGDAFARMEGNSLQDNESGKEEEEENWTSSSCRSSSIPSVVQLFTDATPQRNVVVPTSVKWSSPQTSISLLGSSPFTRRPLPRRSLQLEDPEFRSIASDSLASPEGRFLRRHLSDRFADQEDDNENDQDSIQGSSGSLSLEQRLPPNDNTVQVLQSLEWEWFPYGGDDTLLQANNQNVTLLQEQITNTLSELDSTHNRCCKLLHKRIQPHSKKLLTANVAALDLAQNLTICQIYWQRSHESIQLAKHGAGDEQNGGGGGVVGAKNLLSWWDTQESYQKMQNLVEEMAQVFQIEEQLIQRIEEYDSRPEDSLEECQAILEGCRSLEERLKSDPLIRLTCLNQFRTRVSQLVSGNFVTRLHTWLESTTIRCCHFQHFRSVEYSRLVQAVLLLGKNSDSHPLASSICTTIQTALLVETQKAFGMALLDPTDSEDMEDSEYEKELLALSQQSMYLELSRIPIWLHNLVTIRLDFEIQKHPLPAVYHKLCCLLTNVLYGQFRLLEWHKEEAESPSITDEVLTLIYTELLDRRASIWNSCIKVLEECLEEYLKFVGKKKLFEWRDNVHVDSEWWIDLKGLEDVLQLTDQFMSLSAEFLEGVEQKIINDGSMLREKMYTILKKHLRSSHVEAMNTMGLILYKEDWTLVPFKASSPYSIGDTPPPTSTRELVQSVRQ